MPSRPIENDESLESSHRLDRWILPGKRAAQCGCCAIDSPTAAEWFDTKVFYNPPNYTAGEHCLTRGGLGQHAGLVIWEGPRRYVSLGRRFTSRNYITFGHEDDSYFGDLPAGEIDDSEAQSGAPLWLRLAKRGDTYSAWTSIDGSIWKPLGDPLTFRSPLKNPRFGIFAFNGRRESPSIAADFEFLGKGLVLPREPLEEAPWTFHSDCPEGPDLFDGVRSGTGSERCNATWSRPVAKRTWSLTTRVDLLSNAGMAAGAYVQGDKGRVRIVRDYSVGPRISLIYDGVRLEPVPDFPGSPPVYLRLSLSNDRIAGEVSIDGREFHPVGTGVPLTGLGALKRYGIIASKYTRKEETPFPPLRVFFAREDLTSR